jgi:hypothetical protein
MAFQPGFRTQAGILTDIQIEKTRICDSLPSRKRFSGHPSPATL